MHQSHCADALRDRLLGHLAKKRITGQVCLPLQLNTVEVLLEVRGLQATWTGTHTVEHLQDHL